jgi:hypothetical protein
MVDAQNNLLTKTCGECIHYRPDKFNPRKGTCYSRPVYTSDSCNCFVQKTKTS